MGAAFIKKSAPQTACIHTCTLLFLPKVLSDTSRCTTGYQLGAGSKKLHLGRFALLRNFLNLTISISISFSLLNLSIPDHYCPPEVYSCFGVCLPQQTNRCEDFFPSGSNFQQPKVDLKILL